MAHNPDHHVTETGKDQFVFEASTKTVLMGLMGLGLVCLVLTFFFDDELHTRFWSNLLHNTVFFTGIAFLCTVILAAFISAWTGWHAVIKRIFEAYSLFLGVGLVLLGIITLGLWLNMHELYHWADPETVANDEILQGKSAFLNKTTYTLCTFLIVGAWYFFALKLRSLSLDEDVNGTADFSHHYRMRWFAAAFMPIAAFSSVIVIWLWIMSVDPHWYSTMFAWYTTASWFVSATAVTILTIIYLKSKGYLGLVTDEHLHDLGKYMFAFSIFWTYLWFSQYMLIWYSNNGEETIYFHERINNYPVLFFGNLILNFALPFLVLMRNSTKRKYGTLIFVSVLVIFGHWWDFFLMIKPGVSHTAHELGAHAAHNGELAGFYLPGLLEIGTFIGFLAGFLYFGFSRIAAAKLEPTRDPYWGESITHHV